MQVATNYAKKKVLGQAANRIHSNKPSFETDPEVLAAAQDIASKKKQHWYSKKVVATPDLILNERDRKLLYKVKNRAWYLDKGVHCCCFNVGLDGLVGLIPGIGDFIGVYFSLQLIRTACKADLPKWLIGKMMANVMLDFMVGLTPIAGDILDILFKCNWRNAMLFEEYLITRRMDEIRVEKGLDVTLNDDHSVTLEGEGPSSTGNTSHPAPPKSSKLALHHHDNTISPIHHDEPGHDTLNTNANTEPDKKKNKYGTFFKW
ncbi:uncharacterized protein B0P05DRAFT_587942 [Gilbertella persicaria]|uniref:uncharacterized protein n=1 Tax=Gilbertella persicaria TaxID=101096 RepID=UPI00222026D2|nr:uncharacterized protein B0P05DRAFT_587942 [Gilbertella persicaria]KAI8076637.1 hypothetical protein B0P05DRAFT_587942 [Gilbertella persicaria]